MSDFLIIGGGVIGMMTALQLADAGQQVTLVERGECGKEASWAGGGIVSPLYPWRYDSAVSQLSRWSEGVYPSLALRLLEETGIDPEYRQKGLLYLNVDDADKALTWSRQLGKPLERVGADFVHTKEPSVAMAGDSALWMPTLGSVRNPRLAKALKARLAAMPQVTLREQCEVSGFIHQDGNREGRAEGVVTCQGPLKAGRIVVCGGAWAAQLLAQLGVHLPVRPVKGQMIAYQAPKGLVQRVVLKDGRYIIPRADGLLLVGSTLEEAGFDKTTDEVALASLKRVQKPFCLNWQCAQWRTSGQVCGQGLHRAYRLLAHCLDGLMSSSMRATTVTVWYWHLPRPIYWWINCWGVSR